MDYDKIYIMLEYDSSYSFKPLQKKQQQKKWN